MRTRHPCIVQKPVDEKVVPMAWTDYTVPGTAGVEAFESTADAVKHLKANKVAGRFRVVRVCKDSTVNVAKVDRVTIE